MSSDADEPGSRPAWSRPKEADRAYLNDSRAIRALAHPGRLAIFRRLQADGPATATECATVAGMTPSAASYHLRQLAKYGFVGPAPGRGDLRERIWESRVRGYRVDNIETPDADQIAAEVDLLRANIDSSEELVRRWVERMPQEPYAWRAAAMLATKAVRVNADELGTLFERMASLLQPYLANRRSKEDAPPDARLVHVDLRLFPWEDPPPVVLAPGE